MIPEYETLYRDWTQERLSRGRSLIAQMSGETCRSLRMSKKARRNLHAVVADYLSAYWSCCEGFWSFSEKMPGQTAKELLDAKAGALEKVLSSAKNQETAEAVGLFVRQMKAEIRKQINVEARIA